MADPDRAVIDLVREIHARPGRGVIVVTGAGVSALAWLFGQGGASRTVLEALVPYSARALDEFVGVTAEKHVSREEAVLMADRAYERARALAPDAGGDDVFGVSATATIATDYVKRGEHRIACAVRTAHGRTDYSLVLSKGARDRAGEEAVTAGLVLNLVAIGKGIGWRLNPGLLPGEELNVVDERL